MNYYLVEIMPDGSEKQLSRGNKKSFMLNLAKEFALEEKRTVLVLEDQEHSEIAKYGPDGKTLPINNPL